MLTPRSKAAISGLLTSLLLIWTVSAWGADKSKDEQTIQNATTVLQAMLNSKVIPDSLLVTAECIIARESVEMTMLCTGSLAK
jgi:hypothetical protein